VKHAFYLNRGKRVNIIVILYKFLVLGISRPEKTSVGFKSSRPRVLMLPNCDQIWAMY
jgi:hypothetical protein